MAKRGTIVLIPFPFTDLSSHRIRPALVVSGDRRASDDVIVLFISSVLTGRAGLAEVVIKEDHRHFRETGLKVSSAIKCDKIATLDKRIVIGEIGHLSESLWKEIDARLRIVLDLDVKKIRGSSGGGLKR